jgi:biopolymer transport protein TolQ
MDIPIVDMIVRSGLAARIILLLLLLLSIVSWAIVFNRLSFFKEMASGDRSFRARYDKINKIGDVESVGTGKVLSPMAQLAGKGALEYQRILTDARMAGNVRDWSFFLQSQFAMVTEQIESVYGTIVGAFDRGVYLLAVVSSIAPFLGLLGTVWGIMNSFYEIGTQGSASLPVVAPGIAEALVVTLAGLVVAIPALFFYNYFTHRIEHAEAEVDQFREMLIVRMKREILEILYAEKRGTV